MMERTEILKNRMIQMEMILSSYIEMNKHEKKLGKYIDKRAEEDAKTRTDDSVADK